MMKSAPRLSGSPVAWFASLSRNMISATSAAYCALFGMLILKERVAASSFDTTIVVTSGAVGSSPTESLNVIVLAVGAFGAEGAPEAAVGIATMATAIARTSHGRISVRTCGSG